MSIQAIMSQYQAEKLPKIMNDYQQVQTHICQEAQSTSIFDLLPPANRLTGIEKNKENRNALENAGLISLTVINLPEDIRDLTDTVKQIKSKIKGDNNFKEPYDYSKAQHPFSFFRGTLMKKLIHPDTTPFKNLAKLLRNADKTLLDTTIGENFLRKNNINYNNLKTNIKNINYTNKNQAYVYAKNFSGGNPFTELAARALVRTPRLGVLAYGGIETANCLGNIANGENPFKSIYNSTINLAASLTGIGFGGAFGAKHFGSAGSLIGMGIGGILGKLTADALKIPTNCEVH